MRGIHLHFYRAIIFWFLARPIRLASAIVQTVDDRDPGIQYLNGTWTLHGADVEYGGTTSRSKIRGGTAIFNFTGTQVAVYGTLGPVGHYVTHSTYTINQGPPNSFTAPNRIDEVQYRIQFYMSKQLPNSNHTLTIVNQGDWFYLDYLEVTVPDPIASAHDPMPPNVPGPPSQKSPPGSSSLSIQSLSSSEIDPLPPTSITTSSGSESAQSSSVTSPSSSLSHTDSSRSSISLSSSARPTRLSNGGIAGIAIASFTALINCLALIYFYLRRRRADAKADSTTTLMTPYPHPQRRAFSPTFPARIRTKIDANTTFGESSHALAPTTVMSSVDPTASMSYGYSPPPSNIFSTVFSTVPHFQSTRRPEKIAVGHFDFDEGLVAAERLYGSPTTLIVMNATDGASINTDTLPPVYRRY
ncbi:hypothetical protein NLI96_g4507 [Meripilus lineatus]|uniref:Uncharacterized protein n=1 Tax=Meripilus lineatus TaxID=2056292 RepID=A0AAD5V6F8_9APHY|nr:hypothetical protein NLI96_g4507 [Physisporinus lineatus]